MAAEKDTEQLLPGGTMATLACVTCDHHWDVTPDVADAVDETSTECPNCHVVGGVIVRDVA
jgi:hypothetical protein